MQSIILHSFIYSFDIVGSFFAIVFVDDEHTDLLHHVPGDGSDLPRQKIPMASETGQTIFDGAMKVLLVIWEKWILGQAESTPPSVNNASFLSFF